MADEIICLDTSVLINFFRKTKKETTLFFKLTQKHELFAVSVITEYEIFTGCTKDQMVFWERFFSKIIVLPFDRETNRIAIEIFKELKIKSKLIDIPDILIAASAIQHKMFLATLNLKHFQRISNLEIHGQE